MYSIVSAFFSASVWISFFRMPGVLSLMSGNWVLFQTGCGQCVGIYLFMWSMSSGSFHSSIRAWWMKLLRFNLPLVGVYILLCMGFSRRLNLAGCVSSLVSLLSSMDCSPVGVSKEWTGVDLRAPVMILEA